MHWGFLNSIQLNSSHRFFNRKENIKRPCSNGARPLINIGSYREFLLEKHSEAPFVKLLDKGSPPFIQGDQIHAWGSLGRLHACFKLHIDFNLFEIVINVIYLDFVKHSCSSSLLTIKSHFFGSFLTTA